MFSSQESSVEQKICKNHVRATHTKSAALGTGREHLSKAREYFKGFPREEKLARA